MTTKVTRSPAPWSITIPYKAYNASARSYICSSDGRVVCSINYGAAPQCIADGHLLTNAPQLLDAAYIAVDRLELYNKDGNEDVVINHLQQVIAKAEGGEVVDSCFKVIDTTCAIAIIWQIEDVKTVCPNLNDEQALEVLEAAHSHHDATIGIAWDTLDYWAKRLFPTMFEGE